MTSDIKLPVKGKINESYLITKSNSLIGKAYKLSLREQKLVLMVASNIKKGDAGFNLLRFKVSEIAKFLGVEQNGRLHYEIKKITKDLRDKGFELSYTSEKGKQRTLQTGWFASAEYLDDEGEVEIELSQKLMPFFLFLQDNFTQYELGNIAKLSSIYSIRIYEILKMYLLKKKDYCKKKGINQTIFTETVSIEELKYILKIDKLKAYNTRFSKFRDIIELAKKDLEEKCDVAFECRFLKTGRSFTDIEFTFRDNFIKKERQQSLFDESIKPINENLKGELTSLGFSEASAVEIIQKYNENQIIKNIEFALREKKNTTIKNLQAYIITAIKKDYASKTPEQQARAEKVKDDTEKEKEEEKRIRIINHYYALFTKYRNEATTNYVKENGIEALQDAFYSQLTDKHKFLKATIDSSGYKSSSVRFQFLLYVRQKHFKKCPSFVDWLKENHNIDAKQKGTTETDIEFITTQSND